MKERQIQATIRKYAQNLQDKGDRVRVAYKKIEINGTWRTWNSRLERPECDDISKN